MIPIPQIQEVATNIANRHSAVTSTENDQVLALVLIAQTLVHLNATLTTLNADLRSMLAQ